MSIGGSDPLRDPFQAQIWGAGRVAALEHPDRWGGLVDIPATVDDRIGARLVSVLTGGEGLDQVAVRGAGVYSRRLVRAAVEGTAVEPWTPSGTVLVTGGTGALGAAVARWLAGRGAPHLVLTGRRGEAAPGVGDLVAELTAMGARVTVAACDAADRGALAEVLAAIPDDLPLRGVVHAAGVAETAPLDWAGPADVLSSTGGKVTGAAHLDELTGDLDLFVTFSSIAGVWGSGGQGLYAAANAYLDALVQQRRSRGRAGLSVAWGPWAEAGMAVRGEAGDFLRRRGLPALDPQLAIAALARAVDHDESCVVVADVDWERFAPAFTSSRPSPLLADLPEAAQAPTGEDAAADTGSALARRLAAAPAPQRARILLDLVRERVAAVLGHGTTEVVEPDRAFRDLGFTSLTAVELRNVLGSETGLALPATLVFDHPTPGELAEHLAAVLLDDIETASPVGPLAPVSTDAADPIVIVGMSCRYPGGVQSPDDLWRLVASGGDGISGFPADRGWEFADDGGSYALQGGFVAEATRFDAGLFGISPREALAMDPQQRLLLEAAWEAFESAEVDPRSVRGAQIGVFVGASSSGYGGGGAHGFEGAEGHLLSGTANSVISGRVAYSFGLEGPAVTVDTACSSSLVALHLAVQAVQRGECEMALAGGVTVMVSPATFGEFDRQGGLASDGRCKAFAAAADGTGWGEGVGVLLVERLSEARRLGHRVLARVRGSAVNQDGASNGLTAPNGPSQERVIRQALASAGLTIADVDVVEAHGTGTKLGDPIEAQALLATYGQGRPEGDPLWLGSIKSNIGHTQAAAGVAGIIKMVMAMRHGVLPATLHVDEPSPQVDWSRGAVELLTESRPWPELERPRRAGVSSFGISGTNAHVIIEALPDPAPVERTGPVPPVIPWLLSARTEPALRAQADRLTDFVAERQHLDAADLGHALLSRAALPHRAVVLARGGSALAEGLDAVVAGALSGSVVSGVASEGRTAFLFTGQGAQRAGMGRGLYEAFPVFADAFDAVCAELDRWLDRPVGDVVFGGEADLDRTVWAQAGLFAVEVASFRLLESWGVVPDFLLGHSIGEVAAAHCAGVLSLADACALVAARGRLMQALPAGGAMLAVEASEAEVRLGIDGRLDVAAVNGPASVVVSGPAEVVDELAVHWSAEGRRTSRLTVSHAFHSALMEPMLAEFAEVLATLSFDEPRIPVVSNLTGTVAEPGLMSTPDYWVRQVREAVRFADGVVHLAGQGVTRFVELGPDGVLCGLAQQSVPEGVFAPVARRDREDVDTALGALARVWTAGADVDWRAVLPGGRRIELPTYAFQRERYWPEAVPVTGDPGAVGLEPLGHPLLSVAVTVAGGGGLLLTGRISAATHPWLADHVILDRMVVPGAALVEMVWGAGRRAGCPVIRELVLRTPLVLPEHGGVQIQVSVGVAGESGERGVEVYARPEGSDDAPWTSHAAGVLADGMITAAGSDLTAWPPPGAATVPLEGFYEALAENGYGYGPVFRGVRAAWRAGDTVYAEVALPEEAVAEAAGFGLHPALLDAALHAVGLSPVVRAGGTRLPFAWTGARLDAVGASVLRVRVEGTAEGVSLLLADGVGEPVATMESLVMREISAEALRAAEEEVGPDALFAVEWVSAPVAGGGVEVSGWAALGVVSGVSGFADVAGLVGELDRGLAVPSVVVLPVLVPVSASSGDAHEVTAGVLGVVQEWLREGRFEGSRLVVLTRGAMAVRVGEGADPVQAAVWGLLRSAQTEHPGRIVLVDLDPRDDGSAGLELEAALWPGLVSGAAPGGDEWQVAVRGGEVRVPRLVRAASLDVPAVSPSFDPEGTVLITGGTGTLGGLLARHLAGVHGVRHVTLLSRRGGEGAAAAELVAELAGLGAEADVVACDAADRAALAGVLGGLGRPLTGVVHAAGVLDDGVFGGLTAERVSGVLRPKVDAAVNLHELTAGVDLSLFVLYSSVAATFGSGGQANYAAANAFLDALAAQRVADGLVGQSLAWGLWEQASELTGHLSSARAGSGLPTEQALALFDRAITLPVPHLLPMTLDLAAARAVSTHVVPPLLRGLIRPSARRAAGRGAGTDSGLWARLRPLPAEERRAQLLDLVRTSAATVLGHSGADAVGAGNAFRDLGFDSLTSVELRNGLNAVTGLRLPVTLVFDHPTPTALAEHLDELLFERAAPVATAAGTAVDTGEPIAIVGMSCRFPGGADNPEELWRLLAEGFDGVTAFPADRGWEIEVADATYTPRGGFLHDAADFDAGLFGISPREALAMDPQQRLLLEAAWEAFESAGLDPLSMRRSSTGVLVGASAFGYGAGMDLPESEGHLMTGAATSILSGRVSYVFGLEGPAVTVDTACSSSLVAMHWAIQALQRGECAMALTGGVTVMSTPGVFAEFDRQDGLASDGRCKAFSAEADGTVWSEGVGVLVLQRLSDARRDGHEVLAVIRGSAVNQDGASNGLTAPNGPSQERVIRQALATARLTSSEVDVVEAHGTGTPLGDPIEAQALLATYGQDRPADRPLWLGSVKSNIGHTQSAAGVAGVIKMVQAIRHGMLPRTLHADERTPHVDWSNGAVELLTEARPWPELDRPRRAAVSSFGISGTNAHIILEQGDPSAVPEPEENTGTVLWPVSARTPAGLRGQAERLRAFLATGPELTAAGHALAVGRAALEHRAVAIGDSAAAIGAGLTALVGGAPGEGVVSGVASEGRTAFLFTGQGAQRAGMGRGLYESFPVFAAAFDAVCAQLDPRLERSVRETVFEGTDLDRTVWAQAGLFAVEVASFRLLESWGVVPDFLLGHSIGEVAAAHCAGVLSLADACALVAARGRLMQALPAGGAMLAVEASEAEVRLGIDGRLDVAAVNGPASVVVSGPAEVVDELAVHWSAEGRRTSRLTVSHAFHSALMEPMLSEFGEILAELTFAEPRIPIVSDLTGAPAGPGLLSTPGYWMRQVREAVRFADGVAALQRQGVSRYVELGPDAVLCGLAAPSVAEAVFAPLMRRDRDEHETALHALARLWTAGVDVDWPAILPGGRRVALPTYAFQRERYWPRPAARSGDIGSVGQLSADHPLLGAMVQLAGDDGLVLTGRLSLSTHPWLADHAIQGRVLVPGTALVDMALRAGEQIDRPVLEELVLQAPLPLPEHGGVHVQVRVAAPGDEGDCRLEIHARPDTGEAAPWVRHAVGTLTARAQTPDFAPAAWPPAGADPVALDGFYEVLAENGYGYGPVFRGVRAAWRAGDTVYAEVALPEEAVAEAAGFGLHPALLDAALHVSGLVDAEGGTTRLPFAWTGVRLHAIGASTLRVAMSPAADGVAILATDELGTPVASVDSLVLREVSAEALQVASGSRSDALFAVEWVSAPVAGGGVEVSGWAALGVVSGVSGFADVAGLVGELDRGLAVPSVVVLPVLVPVSASSGDAHEVTAGVLGVVQEWLREGRFEGSRLVVLTRGAMAVRVGEGADPVQAAVWGLLRSAQTEHPGRIVLVDLDPRDDGSAGLELEAALWPGLVSGAAPGGDEWQVAVRGGEVRVPRLVRAASLDVPAVSPSFDPEGTVLITGGTGTLGGLLARHLAGVHGVRHVTLLSRRGGEGAAAAELVAELAGLGAEADVVACDAADRAALAGVLGGLGRPLTGVVHAAGVLDDGVFGGLTAERVSGVLRPKVDAAVNLHELTAGVDLSLFVLYSSVAATFGSGGQANYAAANAFLDALAAQRVADGLVGQSLAWGLWEQASELTGHLSSARAGSGLPTEQALALFDRAITLPVPHLLPMKLDLRPPRTGEIPPLFRALVRAPMGRTAERGAGARAGMLEQLRSLDAEERRARLLDLVRAHVATVLGHAGVHTVGAKQAFKDLGLDSLTAVELRNGLNAATGLRLPATLVFDYPTPDALADHLAEALSGRVAPRPWASAAVVATEVDEPIAIVGMSCRYPGGANDPEQLWRLLAEGFDGVTPFPADRGWRVGDASYAPRGGFLDDVAGFDAELFGISPREALVMDPQQRILLEASWEALEAAGLAAPELRGTPTGVFVGAYASTYGVGAQLPPGAEGYLLTGTSMSVVSGRVAYTFGLEGPAVTVDTACSSSLVAMHLAAQALRRGECELALAGGVAVLAGPNIFAEFDRQGGLAADGRCKPFASAADGTTWSEGVGVLVLERLSDALRHGREIHAVIRGSAVNQDGASNGLTAPNGPSQQRVIRQALADSRLLASEVDAVEAHGTGTSLGDPIEAQALLATYGQDRPADRPLWLGSIKSNIGHTQAAAGVAGVIKMVQAMRHGTLPATLHVDEPTHHVDWSAGAVELLTEARPWPAHDRPRRAGVSSFGISGTNAHIILESAPSPAGPTTTGYGPMWLPAASQGPAGPTTAGVGSVVWPVSGRTPAALHEQARSLCAHLTAAPELEPADVAWSLATTRAGLEHRAVAVGRDGKDLRRELDRLAAEDTNTAPTAGHGGLALLFTGQGSQRAGMGRELYEAFPVFAEAFDAVCAELDRRLDRPVKDVVFEGTDLDRTVWAQAGLFAVEVAAFRLFESWGVVPGFLLGHSIGEVAAAHVAGVLSLADACALVAARGRLMQALPGGGAMLAVQATEAEARAAIGDRLDVAAVNGPTSVVVSGAAEIIGELAGQWSAEGRRTSRLTVSHAFHSALMEPMLAEFTAVLKTLTFAEPRIPIVSDLTGAVVDAEEIRSPEYWARQVRGTVRFADGITHLAGRGVTRYLELGPDGVLCAMAQQSAADAVFAPVLRRGHEEAGTALRALGRLWAAGVEVDWRAVLPEGRRVPLPTYAFQRSRFWLEPATGAGDVGGVGQAAADHPLLGATVALAGEDEVLLTGRLSLSTQPWLADHAVLGRVLVPGTAFVEMALRAGEQVGFRTLRELVVASALPLPPTGGVQVQVRVTAPGEDGDRRVEIHARPDEGETPWVRHATGVLAAEAAAEDYDLAAWPPPGAEPVELDGFYEALAEGGYGYGPAFQGVRAAWRAGASVYAEVALPEEVAAAAPGFGLHPALLDAALHVIGLAEAGGPAPRVPFAWTGIRLHATGAATLRVEVTPSEDGVLIRTADGIGAPVASVDSLVLRETSVEQLPATGRQPGEDWLFAVEWTPAPALPPVDTTSWCVLGGAEAGVPGERVGSLAKLPEGAPVPPVVVLPLAADEALRATSEVLETVRTWLADDRFESSRLVVLTSGAVDPAGAVRDLPGAAVWGLLRSAQSEHPDRFVLVDADTGTDAWHPYATAAEPQLAVRDGQVLLPRLARVRASAGAPVTLTGTVLVTGGTGALGGLVARHLAEAYGVRHLLLLSRRGADSPGAADLVARLAELGSRAEVVACDAADRDALAEVIAAIPAERPLRGVVHTAGVLDDGVVESLTPERIATVFRPKADAAVHLHELTLGTELELFVLFSSAAGTFGSPGQANYAAANTFLDALATRRRALGLPGLSLAWGVWEEAGAMTGHLGDRAARLGDALTAEQGLALFDAALTTEHAHLVPVRLDLPTRPGPADIAVPAILRGLLPGGPRRANAAADGPSLPRQLAGRTPAEQARIVLDVVRADVAQVLGHATAEAVSPERGFIDLGFDSLTAVELRNRLAARTGLRLPATLVFDQPSARRIAEYLTGRITSPRNAAASLTERVERIEAELAETAEAERITVVRRLQALLARYEDGAAAVPTPDVVTGLDDASDDEIFDFIDKELGAS
ncbi:type I polyketide synthase [Streptomyces sp. RPA4-5]|uniref:type I polyketide synthase n=1 Tax=Streptomyces sp. RPA4-5 TaxID=2721245 RepID=UPI002001E4FB|nr:type I polyketide synthase [Streptomyces sp. RPA4-5]